MATEPTLTTVGQLLINSAMPAEQRDYNRVFDKKSLYAFLTANATTMDPDNFREMVQRLSLIGLRTARQSPSASFSLQDLKPPPIKQKIIDSLRQEIKQIIRSVKDPAQRDEQIVDAVRKYQTDFAGKIYDETFKQGNPFAMQVFAGARGNKNQLASMIGSDLLYADNKGRPVPVPVLHSYAEGVDPVEYWAGSYGARSGSIDVKLAVGDAGYFAKRLTAAAHRLVATDEDVPENQGMLVDTDDDDNMGSILARDYAGFKRGTPVDSRMLKQLKAAGMNQILVCSPIAAVSQMNGLPRWAAGIREHGKLADLGMNVGITAAQAIAEPVSQGMLCLAAGTRVRMADGSTKAIEDIEVGDMVLGADVNCALAPVKVLNTYDNGVRLCHTATFGLDQAPTAEITCTLDHKLLIRHSSGNRQCPLHSVLEDVPVLTATGGTLMLVDCWMQAELRTYDIEVDNADHLFVLANGLIVSNSSKHGGGVAKGKAARTVTGFDYLNQLVEVPKTFTEGATAAGLDGVVGKVEDAPQGGKFVYIGDQQHYVPVGQEVLVKPGQAVEAGDSLSDGIVNPKDIAEHKGIGEARRRFVYQFRDAMKQAGMPVNRRNVEVLARGLINQVEMTEPDVVPGVYPEDIVSYDYLSANYKPRQDSLEMDVDRANNHYLEQPVLHYSIGTRITPSVSKTLTEQGLKKVWANPKPPPFKPTMTRAMMALMGDKDWMVQLGGFNLKRTFLENIQRGSSSKVHGTSWIPALATGEITSTPKGTY